jgi:hypothetical protein
VTLGSPQRPPPADSGIRDVTGGALTYVDRDLPGKTHASLKYVCVSGRAVRGRNLRKEGEKKEERSLQTYASGSYEQVRVFPVPSLSYEPKDNLRVCN